MLCKSTFFSLELLPLLAVLVSSLIFEISTCSYAKRNNVLSHGQMVSMGNPWAPTHLIFPISIVLVMWKNLLYQSCWSPEHIILYCISVDLKCFKNAWWFEVHGWLVLYLKVGDAPKGLVVWWLMWLDAPKLYSLKWIIKSLVIFIASVQSS